MLSLVRAGGGVSASQMFVRGALPSVASRVAFFVQKRGIHTSNAMCDKIHSTLGESFFNREQEVEDVTEVFRREPAFSLFLGPPNTGKTALLTKVLFEMNQHSKTPVVYIDLRGSAVYTPEMLYDTLATNFALGWKEELKELLRGMPLQMRFALPKFSGEAFEKKWEVGAGEASLSPVHLQGDAREAHFVRALKRLLEQIDAHMPMHSKLTGKKVPTIFIDEANLLGELTETPLGTKALKELMTWVVRNTKQHPRYHVVFGSSSSFFHLWIQEYVEQGQHKPYVIGDLSRAHARRFFEEHKYNSPWRREGIPPPKFDRAYRVTGGQMMAMREYIHEHYQTKGKRKLHEFSGVVNTERELVSALLDSRECHGESLPVSANPVEQGGYSTTPPLWTRDDIFTVMELFARRKYLVYHEVAQRFGKPVIDSLVQHHVVHLRPVSRFAYDIPGVPDEPIVTPMRYGGFLAMKRILKKWSKEREAARPTAAQP